ncbi:MAG: pilus assembly protein TadG-related protein [Desulfobaccales bacterium]
MEAAIQARFRSPADESGSVTVMAALAIVVLLGAVGIGIDIGRMALVKSELQKAADSGALAGARGLNMGPPFPNWTKGKILATDASKKNQVDGHLVTDTHVDVGYWDLSWKGNTTVALKSTGIVPTATDVPAVRVNLRRDAGQNGGRLAMLFASALGFDPASVRGQTTAIILPMPVNCIEAGMGFPLATPETFVKTLWGLDPPQTFRIGSSYHDPTGGQWTSFLTDANDVPTIRSLIDSGNPGPLKVGDEIYITPGTKSTLYNEAATRIGDTVVLPVVADDFLTKEHTPILGFVPFKITAAQGGDGKFIEGHFVNDYNVPGGIGAAGTTNYGAKAGNPKVIQ